MNNENKTIKTVIVTNVNGEYILALKDSCNNDEDNITTVEAPNLTDVLICVCGFLSGDLNADEF